MENNAIRTYMALMAEKDEAVQERNSALDERRRAFAERDMAMLQRDAAIAERNTAIEERDKVLRALERVHNIMYDDEKDNSYTMSDLAENGYDSSQVSSNSCSQHVDRDFELVKTKKAKETKGASSTNETTDPTEWASKCLKV